MNVLQMHNQRTLAHVLLEITHADKRWRNHWDEENEGELLDQLDELRKEARTMVEALTGAKWDHLMGAIL